MYSEERPMIGKKDYIDVLKPLASYFPSPKVIYLINNEMPNLQFTVLFYEEQKILKIRYS